MPLFAFGVCRVRGFSSEIVPHLEWGTLPLKWQIHGVYLCVFYTINCRRYLLARYTVSWTRGSQKVSESGNLNPNGPEFARVRASRLRTLHVCFKISCTWIRMTMWSTDLLYISMLWILDLSLGLSCQLVKGTLKIHYFFSLQNSYWYMDTRVVCKLQSRLLSKCPESWLEIRTPGASFR